MTVWEPKGVSKLNTATYIVSRDNQTYELPNHANVTACQTLLFLSKIIIERSLNVGWMWLNFSKGIQTLVELDEDFGQIIDY